MFEELKYLDESTHGFPNLVKERISDAGLDIRSEEEGVVPAKSSRLFNTKIKLAISNGMVGILKSRSGLSVKHSIEVGAGVIDSEYRGEVKVHLFNHSNVDYYVKKGDKIAQLLTLPISLEYYKKVTTIEELGSSSRGEKGFNSSGY